MSAPLPFRRGAQPGSSRNPDTAPGAVSPGEFSAARPFDFDRFRLVFPQLWSDLLRRHFHDSEHVAYFFAVDERTARNWLEGTSRPTGDRAIGLIARMPPPMRDDFLARCSERLAA